MEPALALEKGEVAVAAAKGEAAGAADAKGESEVEAKGVEVAMGEPMALRDDGELMGAEVGT